MNDISIAVLITSYNRRETTLTCLKKLYLQEIASNIYFDVYLVDDNSTDGTADSVRLNFPDVNILQGNGSLFWCGGMRLALSTAAQFKNVFFLWLNDDTFLNRDALQIIVNSYCDVSSKGYDNSIIIGSTYDPKTGTLSYGGVRQARLLPLKFYNITPGKTVLPCLTGNGNCVLIPYKVYEIVGNIDPLFTHVWGDFDYGLRANKLGCAVWIAPGYIGSCENNDYREWSDYNLTFAQRLNNLSDPKELFFLKERKIYMKRHAGLFWFLLYISPIYHLIKFSLYAFILRVFRFRKG